MSSKLLVIDDDPLFRTLICGSLKAHYEMSTAKDGHQGFQSALLIHPDAVILDLLMPTWDGVQTLRAFRADDRLKHIPVMILTSEEHAEAQREAEALGCARFLSKCQFSRDALLDAVKEVCPFEAESTIKEPKALHESVALPAEAVAR